MDAWGVRGFRESVGGAFVGGDQPVTDGVETSPDTLQGTFLMLFLVVAGYALVVLARGPEGRNVDRRSRGGRRPRPDHR